MKTRPSACRSARAALATCLGAFLFPLMSLPAAAQPAPLGAWDIVLSGRERGVAQIAFFENGTLDGLVVYSFKSGAILRTNGATLHTNLYGAATVQGNWVFDRTNRISGYMNWIAPTSATSFVTNGFSFRGVAKATRLNLEAYGGPGNVTLRGVPLATTNVVDLAGDVDYLGSARARNSPFPVLEVFRLSTDTPNAYAVEGGGPAFAYTGTLLISSQRFAALFQDRGPGPGGRRVAAYAGSFNPKRRKGDLIGTDGVNYGVKYRFAPEVP